MFSRLYSNCFIVEGSKRSVICDFHKLRVIYIPNDLFEILSIEKTLEVDTLISKFGENNKQQINKYIDFLIFHDVLHITNDKEIFKNFPSYNLLWEWPASISNLIVDLNFLSKIDFYIPKLRECSEILLCQNLQIRIFDFQGKWSRILYAIQTLLIPTKDSLYRSIELIFPYTEDLDYNELNDLLNENLRITSTIIFSVPFAFKNSKVNLKNVVFSNDLIRNQTSCGVISSKYFTMDLKHFTEAQHHNTCLNRKISIDVNGEIKNCPSMAKSYGNIKDTTLAEAIEKPGFKDMWFINKDQIAVCKDCEFRYICTDCRAYIENPEDIYSKPLKCGYNPYTAEWEEWSTNPLKQKAIEYYGMQELVKKDTP